MPIILRQLSRKAATHEKGKLMEKWEITSVICIYFHLQGIEWTNIEYFNNSIICDLIENVSLSKTILILWCFRQSKHIESRAYQIKVHFWEHTSIYCWWPEKKKSQILFTEPKRDFSYVGWGVFEARHSNGWDFPGQAQHCMCWAQALWEQTEQKLQVPHRPQPSTQLFSHPTLCWQGEIFNVNLCLFVMFLHPTCAHSFALKYSSVLWMGGTLRSLITTTIIVMLHSNSDQ